MGRAGWAAPQNCQPFFDRCLIPGAPRPTQFFNRWKCDGNVDFQPFFIWLKIWGSHHPSETSTKRNGCFLKWWYPHFTPQNDHIFSRENPWLLGKPTIFGGNPQMLCRKWGRIASRIRSFPCRSWSNRCQACMRWRVDSVTKRFRWLPKVSRLEHPKDVFLRGRFSNGFSQNKKACKAVAAEALGWDSSLKLGDGFRVFSCSPRSLGKMNPFGRVYFSNGLLQPPTR